MVEIITPEQYHLLMEEEGRKKGNKYGAIPVRDPVDGYFASTGEHMRWCQLKLLRDQGEVRALRRQVPYDLWVGSVKVCRYVADFVYHEKVPTDALAGVSLLDSWQVAVEDFKGKATQAYRIKKQLMLACFGIALRETGR